MYLSAFIEVLPVQRFRTTASKNRSFSRTFYLKSNDIDQSQKRVCLKFFCATFAISSKTVVNLMKKISTVSGADLPINGKKGKIPHNVTPAEDIDFVMSHIDSFPRVPSHYCRKDTRRQYLSSELNLATMYRLYAAKCIDENRKKVCETLYRNLFLDHDPPLSFYSPKKDQCPVCNVHKRLIEDGLIQQPTNESSLNIVAQDSGISNPGQEEEEEEVEKILAYANSDIEKFEIEYTKHKLREKQSLTMKEEDKTRALTDKTFRSITFDLQAILQCPYAAENQLYYTRKLNVYNFTIFDSYNSNGINFLWDECNGKKGSNEIGSCLLAYLKTLPPHVKHVASFSDTCGGQNRNRNIAAAMLYAVTNISTIEIIDIKFMESGHSYLEADSMHARIEEGYEQQLVL